MGKPKYLLVVNPDFSDLGQERQKVIEEVNVMNCVLKKLGEVCGWQDGPRWDKLFDYGLKAIIKNYPNVKGEENA